MFTTVVGLLSAMASCSAPVCWLSHMKQETIVHCPLSIRDKTTAGVILPVGECDWLDWSSDKDDTLGLAQGRCNTT